MRTRSKTHAAQHVGEQLPPLPLALQLAILDRCVAAFPFPEADYAELYPFKSSLAWLLRLRLVCPAWDEHLRLRQAVLARRVRLEQLLRLSLRHDFAHHIVARAPSKQQRARAVPRSVRLQYADGSAVSFAVPRGGAGAGGAGPPAAGGGAGAHGAGAAASQGLPSHALVLLAGAADVTSAALRELLADLDLLDRQHAAPMVAKLLGGSGSGSGVRPAAAAADGSGSQLRRAGGGGVPPVEAQGHLERVAAVAAPLLRGSLSDVVMEGGVGEGWLLFIPTSVGFCRRVPAARS